MSHHITNAGAFYAYVSKGIGKVAGVGTAFLALIAYNSMQIGILGLFGAVFSGFMLRQGRHRLRLVHVGLRRDRRDRHPRLAPRRPEREGARDLPHRRDHRRRVLRSRRRRRPRARRGSPATRSTPRSPSAPASAPRSASRWPPSSASSRRRSTARSARTHGARSPGRPTSRSGSPRSSTRSPPGCCRARSAPTSITNADALVEGGFVGADRRPRSDHGPLHHARRADLDDDRRHRHAALLHQPVRRVALVPQRGLALLLRPRARRRAAADVRPHATAAARRSSARSPRR